MKVDLYTKVLLTVIAICLVWLCLGDMIKSLDVRVARKEERPEQEVKPTPATSTLRVTTKPLGASVYIDGELKGKTPIKDLKIEPGSYSVVIEKEGYSSVEETVLVKQSEKVEMVRDLLLIPGITITTRPSGASVKIDGELKGKTPIKDLKIDVGSYSMVIEKEGYSSIQETVEVKEGKKVEMVRALPIIAGCISVKTEPEGCHIYVDDKLYGVTPREIDEIKIGTHRVTLSHKDYEPKSVEIEVVEGETTELTEELKGLPGKVLVTSEPSGAQIWLNRKYIGKKTPATIEGVESGEVNIELKLKAYEDAVEKRVLKPNSSLTFTFDLKRRRVGLKETANSIGMKLVLIPAGEFMMGSPSTERKRDSDEVHQRKVRITKPFYIGKYEVTQSEYEAVMGKNPSRLKGANNPADSVSWNDAVEFCKKLSWKEGITYRLPTEAEWEYACRAGTTTAFHYGDSLSSEQANFDGKYPYGGAKKGPRREKTMPVGSFRPNAWGLHDMHGNVWEWCSDWYDKKYYSNSGVNDPEGPGSGKYRVLRGGSWDYSGWYCRSAQRVRIDKSYRDNNFAFRVARTLQD